MRRLVGLMLVAVVLVLAGCSQDPPPAATTRPAVSPSLSAYATPSPTPLTTRAAPMTASRRALKLQAIRTLERYLTVWRREGAVGASRFLVPAQRARHDSGVPRLAAGSIVSARVSRWRGPDDFTLYVTLDLTFEGDSAAWNRGLNDRFVTVHSTDGRPPLLLEFATSP